MSEPRPIPARSLTFALLMRWAALWPALSRIVDGQPDLGRKDDGHRLLAGGTWEPIGLPGTGVSYATAHRWRHHAKRHGPNVLSRLLGLFVIYLLIRAALGG